MFIKHTRKSSPTKNPSPKRGASPKRSLARLVGSANDINRNVLPESIKVLMRL